MNIKRIILFELILLFLATTFMTDSTGGWVQQTLPRSDILIQDIFFLDSLTGWTVAQNSPSEDTAFVFKTTNGGINWVTQSQQRAFFYAIQFINIDTGYIAGSTGIGKFYKTTNGGMNWNLILSSGSGFEDLFFVNKDTGWICDNDATFGAGLLKTTNGGVSWISQLPASNQPTKLFFLNKDTGWVSGSLSSTSGRLFRTINGGTNWNLQYSTTMDITSIFFLNSQKGWIRGGTGNGCMYTTDGGFNWFNSQGNIASGYDVKFVNDSIGYSGGTFQKVAKSTDGGKNWGYQNSPVFESVQTFMFRNDTMLGYMGSGGFIKTTDGGGQIIYTAVQQISSEIPSDFRLFQNYPNPFNPNTNIEYELKVQKYVKLIVFDISGKEISVLIDQKQNAGTYIVNWDAVNQPSGIYFYSLSVDNKTVETKKMVLVK